MKTSIKIIAIGALLSCVACGAKKSTQSKMEKDQQEMSAEATDETQGETAMNDSADRTDRMEDGTEESSNSNQMSDDANANADSTTEATSTPSSSNMDYLEMYSKLEMTDDQIQKFEGGLRDFYTQQKNTASGEMMGTLSDERERQLKEILSEEQYSAYKTWKTDN